MTIKEARKLAVDKVFRDFFLGGDIESACRKRGIAIPGERHLLEAALIEKMTEEYLAE